jgi:hypothetical protein
MVMTISYLLGYNAGNSSKSGNNPEEHTVLIFRLLPVSACILLPNTLCLSVHLYVWTDECVLC